MMKIDDPHTEHIKNTLLIVDDEANMRHMLSAMLEKSGYDVQHARNGQEALHMVAEQSWDFILCDLKMPKMGGLEFLEAASEKLMETTVIMMSAYGTIDLAIESMKKGAYDFISKPFKKDEVLLALKKAEERERLKRENRRLKERISKIKDNFSFENMVGRSKVLEPVFNLAQRAALVDSTVLITGESGTGKELIAQGIHNTSHRSGKPMVPLNCGGIPETLLESELFGHLKGAFTGADREKAGLFEEAEGGTIFLDEIGELSVSLQVKLLRVLQEHEIRPVGGSRVKKIDVRVIAATGKELEKEIQKGRFREDLFYRLNVLRIEMPPLRKWSEDIPLLCHHFITLFNEKLDKQITHISSGAMQTLISYPWPGNVRELENAIQRAMVMADDRVLKREHFSSGIAATSTKGPADGRIENYSLKSARRALEKELIEMALRATDGNRTHASRLLEISHPSLLSKIKAYDIDL